MPLLWLATAILIFLLMLLDLFVLRRKGSREHTGDVIAHGAFWLVLAMLFNMVVFLVYHHNVMGAAEKEQFQTPISGGEASLQYLCSFLLELVLSIDSVFVVAAVFAAFRVREDLQHRLLFWGIPVAMLMHGLLILGIGAAINSLAWTRFILCAFLLVAAIRMILVRKDAIDPHNNRIVSLVRRFLPVKERDDAGELVSLTDGKPALTPLIFPLLLIEAADAFMALDSIPASYAFTREPWIIFCASCFAMLCLRSLSPALAQVMGRLRYFKLGGSIILVYSAIVIALPVSKTIAQFHTDGWILTTPQKLAFVTGAILFGVLLAWSIGPSTTRREDVSALGEEADRLAREALIRIRKIVVFVVGVTGLIVGGIMAIGPGPGIPIFFIALLLLAGEFVWARRLVNKYRPVAEKATLRAAEEARKRFPRWVLISITSAIALAAAAIAIFTPVPTGLAIGGAIPLIVGNCFLYYLAYVRPPEPDTPPSSATTPTTPTAPTAPSANSRTPQDPPA